MRRISYLSLVAGLVLVAVPALFVAIMFRSFLYYPTSMDDEQTRRVARAYGFEVTRAQSARGVELVGLVRSPSEPGAAWVLFFGGNAMDLASSQWALNKIAGGADFGLAVFAYRGYDGSSGSPTEEALLHDAVAIAAWLEEQRGADPSRLVLVGQSLGSGIAAHVSATLARAGRNVKGLALLSPYTSIARVFDDHVPLIPVGWVVEDRYDTMALIPDLPGPIVIVHGTEDEIIGVGHGRELAGALGERARIVLLEGCGHNDLWEDPQTADAVRDLLR